MRPRPLCRVKGGADRYDPCWACRAHRCSILVLHTIVVVVVVVVVFVRGRQQLARRGVLHTVLLLAAHVWHAARRAARPARGVACSCRPHRVVALLGGDPLADNGGEAQTGVARVVVLSLGAYAAEEDVAPAEPRARRCPGGVRVERERAFKQVGEFTVAKGLARLEAAADGRERPRHVGDGLTGGTVDAVHAQFGPG